MNEKNTELVFEFDRTMGIGKVDYPEDVNTETAEITVSELRKAVDQLEKLGLDDDDVSSVHIHVSSDAPLVLFSQEREETKGLMISTVKRETKADEHGWFDVKKKPVIVQARGPIDEEFYIETLEGNMLAEKGDYIIKGVRGEIYPVKPEIFKETYERVNKNER